MSKLAWSVDIADGYCNYRFVFPAGAGHASVQSVAYAVARHLAAPSHPVGQRIGAGPLPIPATDAVFGPAPAPVPAPALTPEEVKQVVDAVRAGSGLYLGGEGYDGTLNTRDVLKIAVRALAIRSHRASSVEDSVRTALCLSPTQTRAVLRWAGIDLDTGKALTK